MPTMCFLFPGHAHWGSFFLLQRKSKVRKRLWGGKPSFHCGRPTFTRSQQPPSRGGWQKKKKKSQSGFSRFWKWDLNCSKYGCLGALKSFCVCAYFTLRSLRCFLSPVQFLTHRLHWKCASTQSEEKHWRVGNFSGIWAKREANRRSAVMSLFKEKLNTRLRGGASLSSGYARCGSL